VSNIVLGIGWNAFGLLIGSDEPRRRPSPPSCGGPLRVAVEGAKIGPLIGRQPNAFDPDEPKRAKLNERASASSIKNGQLIVANGIHAGPHSRAPSAHQPCSDGSV
jgi:hypothetical protein